MTVAGSASSDAPSGGVAGLKKANELPDLTQLRAQYPYMPALPPTAKPSFTAADIEAAVPKHCFERNTLTSFMHTAKDLAIVAAIGYAGSYIPSLPLVARLLLWPVYWYALGTVMTGLWVIAHECGHQAFSPSRVVNDAVGFVLHSCLLVPYWSWKYSHSAHHKNTNSCENDEVFVPPTRKEVAREMFHDTPLGNAVSIFAMLTIGWPGHLIMDSSGPAKHREAAHKSHFHPLSALFEDEQRLWVALSDVGFFGMILALCLACGHFGALNVLCYYGVPYLVVNAHLVLITFLQHTDVYVPHFRGADFTFLRGALSTVDRSYSPLLDVAFHHITDTHVAHHLFSKMPWYHAQEATAAIRKVIGPYYLQDPTPVTAALYRAWSQCRFVEDEGGVVFYKSVAALGTGSGAEGKSKSS